LGDTAQEEIGCDRGRKADSLGHGRVAPGGAVLNEGRSAMLGLVLLVLTPHNVESVLHDYHVALLFAVSQLLLQESAQRVDRSTGKINGLCGIDKTELVHCLHGLPQLVFTEIGQMLACRLQRCTSR